ncbi:MAG: formate dehydrogenase accessory sulfurtransferase FdhD [Candidatus Omnitrophica bacterium]|nr:formate dehydrogenase accessory sulfurtransferase FdhD [Candidatus Omnitrophota bacterium]
MKQCRILFIQGGRKTKKPDWLTEEVRFKLFVNNRELTEFLASPADLRQLIYGHLYAAGIIREAGDIRSLRIDSKKRYGRVTVKSGGKNEDSPAEKSLSGLSIPAIAGMMKKFKTNSNEFKKTGAVHSAALCDSKKILIFKEDLGRHNAMDKVVGEALLKDISLRDKILLSSGRLPLEVVARAAACRIPAIVSVSAPTYQSVALARKKNMLLIGFCRSERMNIYSGIGRLTL